MKRTTAILLSSALIFSISLNTFAQKDAAEDISIVLPSQSIAKFMLKLLPYEINLGKNFSGSLWVKSIKDFKIGSNKISFSSHLYGEDITYVAKIGEKLSRIDLGNVDLVNDWEGAFRFDANKKTLYIKPHLKEQAAADKVNQRGIILNVLFKAFSDIEYPIDLHEINPITAEIFGNTLIIGFDIIGVSAVNNKLTVTLRPIPQKRDKIKTPANRAS